EEPMDRAIAESGVLVVAIDMTLAPESTYPACVQDANYAVRWLKTKAESWNGNPAKIGLYGSSSGGHVAELLAMRPRDSRYNAIPLTAAPGADASVAYVAMRPLPECGKAEAQRHGQEQHDVLRPLGHDPRKQSAGDPRPARDNHKGALL